MTLRIDKRRFATIVIACFTTSHIYSFSYFFFALRFFSSLPFVFSRASYFICFVLPDADTCDELDIEMSLIEPSHLSVSVDEPLSATAFPTVESATAFAIADADIKSEWDQCCDDERDNNSLSCRNLQKNGKKKWQKQIKENVNKRKLKKEGERICRAHFDKTVKQVRTIYALDFELSTGIFAPCSVRLRRMEEENGISISLEIFLFYFWRTFKSKCKLMYTVGFMSLILLSNEVPNRKYW